MLKSKRAGSLRVSMFMLVTALAGLGFNAPARASTYPMLDFVGQWVKNTNYPPGSVVSNNGGVYESLENNSNVTPGTNGNVWVLIESKGPTGPQGPKGAAGPQGPQGPTGPAGATGAQGPPGNAGPAGATGAAGAAGLQGPAGPAGVQGPQGLQGPQGPAGPQGAPGAQGPAGPAGAIGSAGPTGAMGSAGPIGMTGPPGANGAPGAQGPQGPQGLPGPAGANGAGVPTCTAPNTYMVLVYTAPAGGALTCQPRFNANGDGTVTDNQTGLMWEVQTSTCSGEITCYNNAYTWSTGDGNPDGTLYTTFLATLNSDVSDMGTSICFANHCDWRIPNIAELQTIFVSADCIPGSNYATCIDPALGPTSLALNWSSTVSGLPGQAWAVGFGSSAVLYNPETQSNPARAVRGGP